MAAQEKTFNVELQMALAMEQESTEPSDVCRANAFFAFCKSWDDPTEPLGYGRENRELWPRLTQLRLYYHARNSHTLSTLRQLEELVSSVRPGVDFRVVKNYELNLQNW